MVSEKKWYAVYTRSRWEKKVAAALSVKNIINYCPFNNVLHQWSDRKKWVEEPLFRSYVFVRVSKEEMLPVIQTDGVLNFVSCMNKPAVIREEEITLIKEFILKYGNIRVETIDVGVDDIVRIVNGPLVSQEGNIVSVGRNKVKVYLPSLGYVMIVEVEKTRIEVIKKNEYSPHSPLKSSAFLQ